MGSRWHEGTTRSSQDTEHLRQRLQVNATGTNATPFHEWVAALVRDGLADDGHFADLGCGIGMLGAALAKGGFRGRYVGVDASATHEESFRRGAPPRAEFVLGGLAAWCRESTDLFDAVASVYSLYYEEDCSPGELLELLLSRTRVGGRVVVVGPFGDNNGSWFRLLRDAGVVIPPRVLHESSGYLEDVASAAARLSVDVRFRHFRNEVTLTAEKARTYWRSVIYREESKDAAVDDSLANGVTIVKEALYLDVTRA